MGYGHIAAEDLGSIVKACDDLVKWLEDMIAKQQSAIKYQNPVLTCADIEEKVQALVTLAEKILSQPRPVQDELQPEDPRRLMGDEGDARDEVEDEQAWLEEDPLA